MPFQRIPRVSDLLPGSIKGLWTIGDPSSWHVELGTHPADGSPSAGASGIRLYGADGATVLIDLSVGATPTITSALIRTAATGRRIEIDGATNDSIGFYTGAPAETTHGAVSVGFDDSLSRAVVELLSPALGHARAMLRVGSQSDDGLLPEYAEFSDGAGGAIPVLNGGNPLPRWADTNQRTLDAGSPTGSTNAAGQVTFSHNLGVVPVAVVATPQNAANHTYRVSGLTASQFTITVRDTTAAGALVGAGVAVVAFFIAVG